MNEVLKQREEFHKQLLTLRTEYEQILQENKALKDEVGFAFV